MGLPVFSCRHLALTGLGSLTLKWDTSPVDAEQQFIIMRVSKTHRTPV